MHTGQVSERSKETVLKTVERKLRGFESRPVRHSLLEEERKSPQLSQETDAKSPPDLGLPGGFLGASLSAIVLSPSQCRFIACRLPAIAVRLPPVVSIVPPGFIISRVAVSAITFISQHISIIFQASSRGGNHGFGFGRAPGFHEKPGAAREKGHAVRALLRPCFRLHDFAGDRVDPSPA